MFLQLDQLNRFLKLNVERSQPVNVEVTLSNPTKTHFVDGVYPPEQEKITYSLHDLSVFQPREQDHRYLS